MVVEQKNDEHLRACFLQPFFVAIKQKLHKKPGVIMNTDDTVSKNDLNELLRVVFNTQ